MVNKELYDKTLSKYEILLYKKIKEFHSKRKSGINCGITSLKKLWLYFQYLQSFKNKPNYDIKFVNKLNEIFNKLNKI